jgi:hypothetical protein
MTLEGALKGQPMPEIHVSTRIESGTVTVAKDRDDRESTGMPVFSLFPIRVGQRPFRTKQSFQRLQFTEESLEYGCQDGIRNPPIPFVTDVRFVDRLPRQFICRIGPRHGTTNPHCPVIV